MEKPKIYFAEWYVINIHFSLMYAVFLLSPLSWFPWGLYFNFSNGYKVAALVHLLKFILFQNENFKAVTLYLIIVLATHYTF